MEIFRMTTLGLFYLGLVIQKILLFFALPLLVFILVSTLILLVKSNPVVASFFVFTALIFAIEMGSSKPSAGSGDNVDPIFYLEDYVALYEGEKEQDYYDDISGNELVSTSYMSSSCDLDSIFYLPQEYVVAYEGEKIQEEDYGDDNNDDQEFCPRLVYVEYKDKSVESVSNLSLMVMKYEEKLVNKKDYYHENSGFHGYAHDGDGGGGGGGGDIEDERDVLNRRIEEFIEKNNRKWEEEMFNDKLTHLTHSAPTELQYAVAG